MPQVATARRGSYFHSPITGGGGQVLVIGREAAVIDRVQCVQTWCSARRACSHSTSWGNREAQTHSDREGVRSVASLKRRWTAAPQQGEAALTLVFMKRSLEQVARRMRWLVLVNWQWFTCSSLLLLKHADERAALRIPNLDRENTWI